MKVTAIKTAAIIVTLASLSFASCKSPGYGCDFGSIDSERANAAYATICITDNAIDEEIIITDKNSATHDYKVIRRSEETLGAE
jgi:hypothetical protein